MKMASRTVVMTLALLTVIAAGGKFTWAVPTCPPLCILPPDPAPPMPPINFPDPPIVKLVTIGSNNGNGTGTSSMPGGAAMAGTATGTAQVGSACQYQGDTGTVTLVNGSYYCDFTPPPAGSACQYQNRPGTVTVVNGKSYCEFNQPAVGSACQSQNRPGTVTVIDASHYCNIGTAGGTDTIVQRIAEPKSSSAIGTSSTTGVSSTAGTSSAPAAAEDSGSSSTTQKKPK
jgi:hypothetical protein